MGSFAKSISIVVAIIVAAAFLAKVVQCDPKVPAMLIFGDSSVDTGNNNGLLTIAKANYPPYGRDFIGNISTGRFSNGKLVIDFISEFLGFTSYQPAFLSPEAKGENLLIGCNFASAGSGYLTIQSIIDGSIPLTLQFNNYKVYAREVVNLVGEAKAEEILSNAIFILNTGPTDFLTYFLVPFSSKVIPLDHHNSFLIDSYVKFIENLYGMGARKIGVTTVSAIGCLPIVRTALGGGHTENNQCVDYVNDAVNSFNQNLRATTESLKAKFPDLRILVLDSFHPLLDIVQSPASHGFSEAGRGCCGLGLLEFSSVLCNEHSVGTCADASQYVFWDAVHQTEAASKIIATSLFQQGAPLIP